MRCANLKTLRVKQNKGRRRQTLKMHSSQLCCLRNARHLSHSDLLSSRGSGTIINDFFENLPSKWTVELRNSRDMQRCYELSMGYETQRRLTWLPHSETRRTRTLLRISKYQFYLECCWWYTVYCQSFALLSSSVISLINAPPLVRSGKLSSVEPGQ